MPLSQLLAIYLELKVIPISFILKVRRVILFHYLLNLEENEMLHCLFQAQLNKPGKNDWTGTVKQDLVDLEINLSFQEIKEPSHDKFKEVAREKYQSSAFKQLMRAKSNHGKMSILNYIWLTYHFIVELPSCFFHSVLAW